MADEKISAMSSGSPAQVADELVIARSGANYRLAVSDLVGSDTLHTVASSGTSLSIDFTNGATQDITLTGNCTFTTTGWVSGTACYITLHLIQDGTGSRTVTWPTITWIGSGVAPSLQTAAGSVDSVVLSSNDGGTTIYGVAQTSASGLASGTSFPGSPSDGDLFYRTDTRILYEYDTTTSHWLSLDRQYVSTSAQAQLSSTSVNGNYGFIPIFEDVYVERWVTTSAVFTTNDASNYYSMTLSRVTPASAATTMGSFTTSSDAVGNWILHNVAVGLVVQASVDSVFQYNITKTGSPGIFIAPAMLVLRSVG